ncbi:hypothetical protein GEMRC1_003796 [Eukaryota sp. GEM-RC1]
MFEPQILFSVLGIPLTEEHLSFSIVIITAAVVTFLSSYVSSSNVDQPAVASMTMKDAARFPFVAGAALTVLFVAIKFLSKIWVNRILTAYFVVLSCFALSYQLSILLGYFFENKKPALFKERTMNINLIFTSEQLIVSYASLFCLLPSAVTAFFYVRTRHWIFKQYILCCILSRWYPTN